MNPHPPPRAKPPLPPWIRRQGDDWILSIRLQPRASRNAIQGTYEHSLRMSVTAPPVDAAANQMLIDHLADVLECSRNRLLLLQGHRSRQKSILIRGLPVEHLLAKLRVDDPRGTAKRLNS